MSKREKMSKRFVVEGNLIVMGVDCFAWCPYMTIIVSVQYTNGGFLPDMLLLTLLCYYHWGPRLDAMERFCLCGL